MDEKKEDGKCGKGCGLHCGCCICKTIKIVVLLLIGGLIGYKMAGCRGHRMCPVSANPMPMETPAPAAHLK